MSLFTNKETTAKLEEANAKIEKLEAEKVDLSTKLATAQAALKDQEKAHEKALAEKEAEVKEKAAALAANQVASSGHEPVDASDEEANGKKTIVEQYLSLKGTERQKFYQENEAEILAAIN